MDTQKDVERLVELVGTGEAATMEYEPEARALMTKLAGQFLADVHRIADALENLVAIQCATCPVTVSLPHRP